MYLIRVGHKPDTRNTYLVPEDELRVSYPIVHRDTGRMIGGLFREVERDGIDKSQLELSGLVRNGHTTNPFGHEARYRYHRLRKSAVRNHVRVVPPEVQAELRGYDVVIDELKAQLREKRRERAEFVKGMWRRCRKVSLLDLEDKIEAVKE
jgi:hypothetical protein